MVEVQLSCNLDWDFSAVMEKNNNGADFFMQDFNSSQIFSTATFSLSDLAPSSDSNSSSSPGDFLWFPYNPAEDFIVDPNENRDFRKRPGGKNSLANWKWSSVAFKHEGGVVSRKQRVKASKKWSVMVDHFLVKESAASDASNGTQFSFSSSCFSPTSQYHSAPSSPVSSEQSSSGSVSYSTSSSSIPGCSKVHFSQFSASETQKWHFTEQSLPACRSLSSDQITTLSTNSSSVTSSATSNASASFFLHSPAARQSWHSSQSSTAPVPPPTPTMSTQTVPVLSPLTEFHPGLGPSRVMHSLKTLQSSTSCGPRISSEGTESSAPAGRSAETSESHDEFFSSFTFSQARRTNSC